MALLGVGGFVGPEFMEFGNPRPGVDALATPGAFDIIAGVVCARAGVAPALPPVVTLRAPGAAE